MQDSSPTVVVTLSIAVSISVVSIVPLGVLNTINPCVPTVVVRRAAADAVIGVVIEWPSEQVVASGAF